MSPITTTGLDWHQHMQEQEQQEHGKLQVKMTRASVLSLSDFAGLQHVAGYMWLREYLAKLAVARKEVAVTLALALALALAMSSNPSTSATRRALSTPAAHPHLLQPVEHGRKRLIPPSCPHTIVEALEALTRVGSIHTHLAPDSMVEREAQQQRAHRLLATLVAGGMTYSCQVCTAKAVSTPHHPLLTHHMQSRVLCHQHPPLSIMLIHAHSMCDGHGLMAAQDSNTTGAAQHGRANNALH